MQVFRLVETSKPDKLIAFDELPKRFTEGLEMRGTDGLPRHWKSFVGEHEKYIPGTLEKNIMTGKIEKIGEERIKAPFFFVLYYNEINRDKERWQEICNFVRRVVHLHFRLLDNIADMAVPMAVDSASELRIEPEDLETQGAIIPIPLEFQEKETGLVDKNGMAIAPAFEENQDQYKCEECKKSFKNEQALKMHNYRKHPIEKNKEVAATN